MAATNNSGAIAFSPETVTVGDFHIHTLTAGQGEPLVLVHGGDGINPAEEATFELARHYRVLQIEMPGWGTEPNTRTRDLRDMGQTVAETVAALHPRPGPVRLMGTSIGAPVVLWAYFSGLIATSHIVLESPAAFRAGGPPFEGLPGPADFNHQPGKRRTRVFDPRVMEFMMSLAPAGEDDPELAARMREIDVPVLSVFGAEDRMVPPGVFKHWYELPPRGRTVLLPAAAHDVKGDLPEVFVKLLLDFLA
ncbi:alpha/beta fold hydrolase [Streptomyces sp. NPDC088747]|uniref:alpha/beta fold hydrolase n=1 Tax=Streptomyces sp. NPDC088747 TaxID=3365886 RepID=UPI00382348E9